MYKISFEVDVKAYKETLLENDYDYNQPKEDFQDYEKVFKYEPHYSESDIRNSVVYADGIAVGTLSDKAVKKLRSFTFPFKLYTHIFGGPYRQYFEEDDKVYSDTMPYVGWLEVEKL